MSEGRQPLPTVDDLYAREVVAVTAVQELLGAQPLEVSTVGALADVLVRLSPDTPLELTYPRTDPELDVETTESRTAVIVAGVGLAFADGGLLAVNVDGEFDVYPRRVPSVILGSVRVAQGAPVLAGSVACEPGDQVVEAMYTGDGEAMMTALEELVREVAGRLDGEVDDSLPGWIADHDLVDEIRVEAARLRYSACRIATLRARVAADLAAQDAKNGDAGTGSTASQDPRQ